MFNKYLTILLTYISTSIIGGALIYCTKSMMNHVTKNVFVSSSKTPYLEHILISFGIFLVLYIVHLATIMFVKNKSLIHLILTNGIVWYCVMITFIWISTGIFRHDIFIYALPFFVTGSLLPIIKKLAEKNI